MSINADTTRVPNYAQYCEHSWVPVQDEPMATCLKCHARKEVDI